MTLVILPDGKVMIPAGFPELAPVARAMGGERAARYCRQSSLVKVLIGKRACG